MGTEQWDQIPIGRFSLLTHLSQKALRIYDKRGLLVPYAKDQFTGYRYYSLAQVGDAIILGILSSSGFSLAEMEQFLRAQRTGNRGRMRMMLEARLEGLRTELHDKAATASMLEHMIRNEDVMTMATQDPVIKDVAEMRVLSKHSIGSYQEMIPRLIGELCQAIYSPDNQRQQACMAGPIIFICHDEEYRENDANVEVVIPVTGQLTLTDTAMEIKQLPGGKVLSIMHKGPYHLVGKAYERLAQYAAEHNITIGGPTRELYLNDPAEVPEEELLTEIQFPIF
jgi:effector-binding domain-containing protein